MNDCNCSCNSSQFDICRNGCCCENECELDCIIANLKSELFAKQQNIKDYCSLESKFIQLQNDIKMLSDQKNNLECELCRANDEGNKLICSLRLENENLKNSLNDKNCENKKLYGDNNNLFQVLEGKTNANQNLQDQMCHQENILQRLNQDKISLQNTVSCLNQLRDKHMKDIQDLNIQINLLNKDTNVMDTTLKNKNCQNLQIINEFNSEKCINNGLVTELNNKECALMKLQQELCMANETLSRLEKDIDILTLTNNRNNDDIICTQNNLVKETTLRNNIENKNEKLNCIINDRNVVIQNLSNENNLLKCSNTNINSDNNFLFSKVEAYKKHILILTDQNEKLSAELEAIISRDSQLLCTLGRDCHLRVIQNENKSAINSSLDYLKACSSPIRGCLNKINYSPNYSPKNEDIKIGSFGKSMNGNGNKPIYNSRINNINIRDGNQYSSGEEGQYSGDEEMHYSLGERHSSGEEY